MHPVVGYGSEVDGPSAPRRPLDLDIEPIDTLGDLEALQHLEHGEETGRDPTKGHRIVPRTDGLGATEGLFHRNVADAHDPATDRVFILGRGRQHEEAVGERVELSRNYVPPAIAPRPDRGVSVTDTGHELHQPGHDRGVVERGHGIGEGAELGFPFTLRKDAERTPVRLPDPSIEVGEIDAPTGDAVLRGWWRGQDARLEERGSTDRVEVVVGPKELLPVLESTPDRFLECSHGVLGSAEE